MVRKIRRDTRVFEVIFLYVMSVMKTGSIYGYELAAKLQELSGARGPTSFGLIYPFLRRMERSEMVRSRKDESSGRIYYELTRKGKLATQELPQRLKEIQEDYLEFLLDPLTVYTKLYGEKALNDLTKRVTERTRTLRPTARRRTPTRI